MSSLSAKDRVSLCSFTFSDGRRCRTPRTGKNPHFCFDHAQKEARAHAAESLSKDLAYFFSGDYLSACDLSTALGRLIPAVIRGEIKPRAARTVAYMAQTLLQAIHISQHEYGEAFGGNAWRQSIRNSVNANRDYLVPPDPEQPAKPQSQPPQSEIPTMSGPAPSPHTPMPPTSAEFVEHVLARSEPAFSARPATSPQPAQTPPGCHSERSALSALRMPLRSEEPAFSSSSAPSPTSTRAPQTPASPSHPNHAASATNKTHPIPATQPVASVAPTTQPACPEQGRRVNPREPDRSAPWLDHTRSIRPDSKLL